MSEIAGKHERASAAWNHHPPLPLDPVPYWHWPPRPLALGKWLFENFLQFFKVFLN